MGKNGSHHHAVAQAPSGPSGMVPAPPGYWLMGYIAREGLEPMAMALPVAFYLMLDGVVNPVCARPVPPDFVNLCVLHQDEIDPEMRKALYAGRWTRPLVERVVLEDFWARQEAAPKIVPAAS